MKEERDGIGLRLMKCGGEERAGGGTGRSGDLVVVVVVIISRPSQAAPEAGRRRIQLPSLVFHPLHQPQQIPSVMSQ